MKQRLNSLVSKLRHKTFEWIIEKEIFERLFPHLEREKNYGYPFMTDQEMATATSDLNVESLFRKLERKTHRMPKAYGEAFRHIMYRDIHSRLSNYHALAERRVNPSV
jgi:hypothetical protein